MATRSPSRPLAHGRQPRSSWVRGLLGVVGIAAAVALVVAGSVAGFATWRIASDLAGGAVDITPEGQAPPTVGAITGPVNILLVGSDSGEGNPAYGDRGENLNDVTILLHISPDSDSATAISFPRDMVIAHPQCTGADGETYAAMSARPINEALSRGGLPCVVQTVASFTDLPIQYAAKIEFDGVVAMSNAIGGVTVCVAQPIDDSDGTGFQLAAGEQTLEGSSALAFLRTRHGVSDGSDLGRISNQQVFLSALVRQVRSAETLSDPGKVYGLATAAADHMELSTELASLDTMASMAFTLRDIPMDRITLVQYPTNYTDDFLKVVPNTRDGQILTDAIGNDQAVIAGAIGQGVGQGTAEPTDPSATPTDPAEGGGEAVQLPASITGQSVTDQTCSNAG